MSEKDRKKKDGEDKNKNNERMRDANEDAGTKNTASSRQGQAGTGRSQD